MKRQIIRDITCLLFIALFVYAATSKLLDLQKFRMQLGQSPMLTTIAGPIAWSIPILEFVIAVLLTLPRFKTFGLYASFSLMTVFSTYIYVITHYSEYIPCSCGGILEKMNWNQHLLFNIIFIFLALVAILINKPPPEKVLSN